MHVRSTFTDYSQHHRDQAAYGEQVDARAAWPDTGAARAVDGRAAGQFDVGVTHRVNITALTGENPFMGEAIIVRSGGRALLGTRFG